MHMKQIYFLRRYFIDIRQLRYFASKFFVVGAGLIETESDDNYIYLKAK